MSWGPRRSGRLLSGTGRAILGGKRTRGARSRSTGGRAARRGGGDRLMWRCLIIRVAMIASLPALVVGPADGVDRVGRRVATKPGARLRVDGKEVDPGPGRRIYTVEAV